MDIESKERELAELKGRLERLESEVASSRPVKPFQPEGFYTAYYATTGFLLGLFGAAASLMFNIVGSLMFGKDALELIRTYLTFPLGDAALKFTSADNGMVLAFGCCLYLGTGMLFGAPFYVFLVRFTRRSTVVVRLIAGAILSLLLWLVNYYVILKYLQPAVIDMSAENLIVNRIPVWVAISTHLVYGLTIALLYPLGQFVSTARTSESS